MFFKKTTIKYEREPITLESLGLAVCEHTKLIGLKSGMVEKKKIINYCEGYICSHMIESKREIPIYFSPIFAPKWDIRDETGKEVKFVKVIPEKQIEIKNK